VPDARISQTSLTPLRRVARRSQRDYTLIVVLSGAEKLVGETTAIYLLSFSQLEAIWFLPSTAMGHLSRGANESPARPFLGSRHGHHLSLSSLRLASDRYRTRWTPLVN